MKHMPYEEMVLGEGSLHSPDDDSEEQERRGGPIDEPGRTPRKAEGGDPDEEKRRIPGDEPGKTPGNAEG